MSKLKKKNHNRDLLSIIFLMLISYMGPGFATGTLTVNYFLSRGWIGVFIGPVIVGFLCFTFLFLLLEINRIFKPQNSNDAFMKIYSKTKVTGFVKSFKDIQLAVLLALALSANISTVGILFFDFFKIDYWMGALFFIFCLLIVAPLKNELFRRISSVIGICLMLIALLIAFICLPNSFEKMISFLNMSKTAVDFGHHSNILAYINMLTITVFFMNGYDASVKASKEIILRKKDSFIIALGSSIILTVLTILFTIIFSAGMPQILNVQVPTTWALTNLNHIAGGVNLIRLLYILFMFITCLGSSSSFLFTITSRYYHSLKRIMPQSKSLTRKLVVELLSIVLCLALSTIGLLNLVKYGYSAYTIVVSGFIYLPLLVMVPLRLRNCVKNG